MLASGVACRPGHPTLLARRGAQLIVGAPGNPFAAHVALHSFVAPAVAAFTGLSSVDAVLRSGVCGAAVEPLDRDRVRLIPATLGADRVSTPVDGAHSHMLTGYATGDVLLVVPAAGLSAGDPVEFLEL